MQLQLLPTSQMSPLALRIWQGLTHGQRVAVTAVLARLMRKAITTEPRRDPDER